MEIKKWLLGSMCAASFVAGFAATLEFARILGQHEAQPQYTVRMTLERHSSSSPAPSAPASFDMDLAVKNYYFEHTSDFAPLPFPPRERAAAFRQIENQIRQKFVTAEKS
jgi:hypothetical protein